ncbi:heme o synthase [Gracilibacillus halophilus]|nr:heme o synthase [Gracilibacillus halophilus]
MALQYYAMPIESEFLLLLFGSVSIVAGALALNNWLEADVDAVMERTRNRPTVTGSLSLSTVFMIGVLLSVTGLILLFLINGYVALYGLIGWFTYVVLYTMWTKRKFTWNTHIGSLSGAVTPLMGWSVVDTAIHHVPLSLVFIMFLWQMPHTYAIAIRKYEDYHRAGLQMLPVVKGYRVTIHRTWMYIVLLFATLFLTHQFGYLFIVVFCLITCGWFAIAMRAFFVSSIERWAEELFRSSLVYLTAIFILYMVMISR